MGGPGMSTDSADRAGVRDSVEPSIASAVGPGDGSGDGLADGATPGADRPDLLMSTGTSGLAGAPVGTRAASGRSADRLEREAERAKPDQLSLFVPGPRGSFSPALHGLAPLTATSRLPIGRAWFRIELEQAGRPRNTIESYCYDLVELEKTIGPIPVGRITRAHVATFLAGARTQSTRKRRLTSLRQFFRFLIAGARVIDADPCEGFFPHRIELKGVVPLFPPEQDAMLAAAAGDTPWALPAVWLMLRLGLSRSELLALRHDHIDLTDPARPVVHIFYPDRSRQGKERRIAADDDFAAMLDRYPAPGSPGDAVVPHGPPAINLMVERVRRAAGIAKAVTPATLRHTFAVERAKAGATGDDLLTLLGLHDDLRNRASVERYVRLASPPL